MRAHQELECNPNRNWRIATSIAGLCALLIALIATIGPSAIAQSGKVVDNAKYTAPYDAMMKVNRLREEMKDETGVEYWGEIQTRLANQAGRNSIKRPKADFSEDAFMGWLAFTKSYGDNTGIGNCASCHFPSAFTDGKKHIVSPGMKEIETPSLREAYKKESFFHDSSAKTLEEAIAAHIKNGEIARERKRDLIDIQLGLISLDEKEIKQVAAFLRSLKPADRETFRSYMIDVVEQPLEIEF